MKRRRTLLLWCAISLFVMIVVGAIVWKHFFPHNLSPEMMKDVRAGIAARHIKEPDKRLLTYMEARYGSMSDPANRQEAFLDFFNVEHVRGLQLLVKHSPAEMRQANIDAMARWVAEYGAGLKPEEKAALKKKFQSEEGKALLRRATAQYNSQDVEYRGNTAPVISQLLRTLNQIEQTR